LTIAYNTAARYGGGIYLESSAAPIGNNLILWGNSGLGTNAQVYELSGSFTATYSCVQDGWPGTGDISDDPMFVNATNSDFHLQPNSPCIDTGDPNSPLDPDSTRADMGALYFDQSSPQIALSADSLWFPATYVGESSTQSFTIYNAGAGNLILNGMSNNLPDIFTYNWVPEDSLITPGDSIVVRVAFSPSDSILYTDDLVIDNNDVQMSVYLEGQGLPVVGIKNGREDLPLEFALLPAHPNPFNPSTTISFQLPVAGFVKLEIFDVNGCRVGVGLEPTRWYPPGHHEITFDGSHLSAGIYFARLTVGDFQQTQKMVLIK